MKCVKKGDQIRRVEEEEADVLVSSGWGFCPKSEWKEKVRGPVKEVKTQAPEPIEDPGSGGGGEDEPPRKKYRKRSAEERAAYKAEKSQKRFKDKTQRSKESQGEQGNS